VGLMPFLLFFGVAVYGLVGLVFLILHALAVLGRGLAQRLRVALDDPNPAVDWQNLVRRVESSRAS
jgi:hypothetical protein